MAEITIKAADENLDAAQEFVRSEAMKICDDQSVLLQIELAVEEIFVNISHYAYGKSGGGDATIVVDADDSKMLVKISFVDSGVPFDPLAKPDPDVTLSLQERGIGGLGIFLTKKYMDRLAYSRNNGKNILSMEKRV